MCLEWVRKESQERAGKVTATKVCLFFDRATALASAVEVSSSVAHDGVWRGFVEAARLAAEHTATEPSFLSRQ